MPELIAPSTAVQASFLAAMRELLAESVGGPDDGSALGNELVQNITAWENPRVFAEYTHNLRERSLEDTARAEGQVPVTTLWWVSGEEYLGRIGIRHGLTEWGREIGGHVGYDVRPSARRQGHATAMLRAVLPVARDLGIDPVLVTCDADNIGSRKTIEANHGVLEDQRGDKLRYWVPAS